MTTVWSIPFSSYKSKNFYYPNWSSESFRNYNIPSHQNSFIVNSPARILTGANPIKTFSA